MLRYPALAARRNAQRFECESIMWSLNEICFLLFGANLIDANLIAYISLCSVGVRNIGEYCVYRV